LIGRLSVTPRRSHVTLSSSVAMFIRDHHITLRFLKSLLRRLSKPLCRLHVTLSHTFPGSIYIHEPQVTLRQSAALLHRLSVPPHRLQIALSHAKAFTIRVP
jgi:hypothetical protein